MGDAGRRGRSVLAPSGQGRRPPGARPDEIARAVRQMLPAARAAPADRLAALACIRAASADAILRATELLGGECPFKTGTEEGTPFTFLLWARSRPNQRDRELNQRPSDELVVSRGWTANENNYGRGLALAMTVGFGKLPPYMVHLTALALAEHPGAVVPRVRPFLDRLAEDASRSGSRVLEAAALRIETRADAARAAGESALADAVRGVLSRGASPAERRAALQALREAPPDRLIRATELLGAEYPFDMADRAKAPFSLLLWARSEHRDQPGRPGDEEIVASGWGEEQNAYAATLAGYMIAGQRTPPWLVRLIALALAERGTRQRGGAFARFLIVALDHAARDPNPGATRDAALLRLVNGYFGRGFTHNPDEAVEILSRLPRDRDGDATSTSWNTLLAIWEHSPELRPLIGTNAERFAGGGLAPLIEALSPGERPEGAPQAILQRVGDGVSGGSEDVLRRLRWATAWAHVRGGDFPDSLAPPRAALLAEEPTRVALAYVARWSHGPRSLQAWEAILDAVLRLPCEGTLSRIAEGRIYLRLGEWLSDRGAEGAAVLTPRIAGRLDAVLSADVTALPDDARATSLLSCLRHVLEPDAFRTVWASVTTAYLRAGADRLAELCLRYLPDDSEPARLPAVRKTLALALRSSRPGLRGRTAQILLRDPFRVADTDWLFLMETMKGFWDGFAASWAQVFAEDLAAGRPCDANRRLADLMVATASSAALAPAIRLSALRTLGSVDPERQDAVVRALTTGGKASRDVVLQWLTTRPFGGGAEPGEPELLAALAHASSDEDLWLVARAAVAAGHGAEHPSVATRTLSSRAAGALNADDPRVLASAVGTLGSLGVDVCAPASVQAAVRIDASRLEDVRPLRDFAGAFVRARLSRTATGGEGRNLEDRLSARGGELLRMDRPPDADVTLWLSWRGLGEVGPPTTPNAAGTARLAFDWAGLTGLASDRVAARIVCDALNAVTDDVLGHARVAASLRAAVVRVRDAFVGELCGGRAFPPEWRASVDAVLAGAPVRSAPDDPRLLRVLGAARAFMGTLTLSDLWLHDLKYVAPLRVPGAVEAIAADLARSSSWRRVRYEVPSDFVLAAARRHAASAALDLRDEVVPREIRSARFVPVLMDRIVGNLLSNAWKHGTNARMCLTANGFSIASMPAVPLDPVEVREMAEYLGTADPQVSRFRPGGGFRAVRMALQAHRPHPPYLRVRLGGEEIVFEVTWHASSRRRRGP